MTTKTLKEIGRVVSAANEAKLKAALTALQEILAMLGSQPSEAGPVGVVQTMQQIFDGLQKLIDTLSPAAKEALEGDADGDNDTLNAILQRRLGAPLLFPEPAEESFREALALLESSIVIELWERDYSTEQRVAMAKKGQAIPVKNDAGEIINGRFPIADVEDLKAAKESYGRSPTDEVKAHINKRAAALGQPAMGEQKESKVTEAGYQPKPYDSDGEGADETIKCPVCGKGNADDAKFCDQCGAKLVGRTDVQPAKESKVQEAGDAHVSGFPNMGAVEQKNHLVSAHDVSADNDNLNVPAKRVSMHGDAHATAPTKESQEVDLEVDFVPLAEAAVGKDGTLQIKVIAPGWGSSGYYDPKVLERDGHLAFPKGTKMFWNHPTIEEEKQRPERDLRDLAAVTTTDPTYLKDGPKGPGLYAMAKPMEAYKSSIEELAPHIGVSIRASGQASKGEAEGKKGIIIERIVRGQSIDFVTEPGAGGAILQSFSEANRPAKQQEDKDDVATDQDLKEARSKLTEAENENKRLRERILLRDAHDMAEEELGKVEGLPVPSVRRLAEMLSMDPPADEDGDLDKPAFRKKIKETVAKEAAYLESILRSGRPRGMGTPGDGGDDSDVDDKNFQEAMGRGFAAIGLDKKVGEQAALGRR